jgi:membrane protein YdbS with pleckstrin-like domain
MGAYSFEELEAERKWRATHPTPPMSLWAAIPFLLVTTIGVVVSASWFWTAGSRTTSQVIVHSLVTIALAVIVVMFILLRLDKLNRIRKTAAKERNKKQ